MRYRHPLSAYQAFCIAIAVQHNQQTSMLDLLPPIEDIGRCEDPQLATNLVEVESLSHAYGVVYSLCVHGSRVFAGTHSGHVQQWQCPVGAAPTVIEWRAHSGTVYSLVVAGRSLVTASRDWLLRVWDLASLTLVATLPGHRGTVRCLACSISLPNIVFSGSNDKSVRVWDMNALQSGDPKPPQRLGGHSSWVRTVACSTNGDYLCSASKEVKVWSTDTLQCLRTLNVGRHWIYTLAVCRVSIDAAELDTLYAGCSKGRVRAWRLSDLAVRDEQTGELPGRLSQKVPVRAMACQGHTLLCGDQTGCVRAYDLSKRPVQGFVLEAHNAGVRAIAVDPLTNVVYSAANDRTVKVWVEPAENA